jgi:steroid delta-isomerase-like uncharacterized protein
MSEANKALVKRWIDAWNTRGNLHLVDALFAADHVDRTPPPNGKQGVEGVRQFVNFFFDAFEDVEMRADPLMAEGDLVCYRWTATARHTGPIAGIPATGKRVTITGITMHRIRNGKVVESWNEYNTIAMLWQLGVLPMPGGVT